ncbi:MAG TPA: hypothetical protein VMY77_01890 [Chitinophagaceae bacterium]|nr:hypothetical protein [Chitinophagaceae bacterium]
MKKLLFIAILAGFTSLGAAAQTSPGNSTYGHSHKKAKKAKKHHRVYTTNSDDRRAINVRHKTAVKTIHSNDVLTNEQQRTQTKQANVAHKQEIKVVTKTTGKKK